ncbi:MAG TPA: ATP-binding protein, partial [Coleofasciculaceae cyanobacterium]
PSGFRELLAGMAKLLLTPIDLSVEAELSVGIAKITATAKDNPQLRDRLRQYLGPRTSQLLAAINQELLKPAIESLKEQGEAGLVVIVDNLDRVDNHQKPWGRPQQDYLFVDQGEYLTQLKCHVVYTMPLALKFSNDYGTLTQRFSQEPKTLPMVPTQSRDGRECEEGMRLMRQMGRHFAQNALRPYQKRL